jgi:hypothetical protein
MTAEQLRRARATEELRQSQQQFDVALGHQKRRNLLELIRGYVAVAVLPLLFALTAYLLVTRALGPAAEVVAAAALVAETRTIALAWSSQSIDAPQAPRSPAAVLSGWRRPGVKR